jgi:ribosome-interacting GTPase 1
VKNSTNSYLGGTPLGQERLGSVLALARLARTPSIAIEMKEEQQIRIRVEFEVQRRRIRVERDRTRVRVFGLF